MCHASLLKDCCTDDGKIRWSRQTSKQDITFNSSLPVLCHCHDATSKGTLHDGLLIMHLFFMCITLSVATLACRRVAARRRALRETGQREAPLYGREIELSLSALVPVPVSPDAGGLCSICLEPLSAENLDLVRPPNCGHVTHHACIKTWINQARLEAHKFQENRVREENTIAFFRRVLSCPVCARSLIRQEDCDLTRLYCDDVEAQGN